jgi:hypothetical protein
MARRCPLEIWEQILGHLVLESENHASLKATSLISRAFVPIAQALHFRTISLHSPDVGERLFALLKSKPTLATYVRHLDLSLNEQHLISDEPGIWQWLSSRQGLELASLLGHVPTLSSEYLLWFDTPLKMSSVTEEVVSAFRSVRSLIINLRFDGIEEMHTFILCFRSTLEYLEVSGLRIEDASVHHQSHPSIMGLRCGMGHIQGSLDRLRSLKMSGAIHPVFTAWLLHTGIVDRIRDLIYVSYSVDHEFLSALIMHGCRALKSFHFLMTAVPSDLATGEHTASQTFRSSFHFFSKYHSHADAKPRQHA